jgi:signal transduction histidine kinase
MTFLQTYRRRLFYKYVVIFVTLVSGVLLTSGLVEIYFSYQETRTALTRIQWEEAENAALKIRQFLKDIERQMAWTLQPLGAQGVPLDQRRDDYYKLLRQVSAITELSYLDASGQEQLRFSRLSRNVVGSGVDASRETKFLEAKSRQTYFSAVYFRNEYEPYMTIAAAEREPDGGVTVAEVDLRLILDVVLRIRVGNAGYAYAVDARGRLIVHPDISLVLQKTDLSSLSHIQAALAGLAIPGEERQETTIARDLHGRQVLTTYEVIDPPGWHVFVEQPLEQAFAPLYASMWRTTLLLLVSLGIAVLVSLVLARKMVIPIQALQAGVARVASGHLDIVIPPSAPDELGMLAASFNQMAASLKENQAALAQYTADLEAQVAVRTRELQASNVRLKELDRLKSEFVSHVSHELRTPLTSVKGYVDYLLEGIAGELSPLQRDFLTRLKGNADRLLRLITDLLDLARIESGQMMLYLERLRVREIVAEVLEMLRPLAVEKGIELGIEGAEAGDMVRADRDRLHQVLLNLTHNAIKFTPPGGAVRVRVEARPAREVAITVEDTGVGIPAEDAERIFAMFHQAHSASTSPGGSGLGLTIAKKLVELQGGRMWLKSHPGQGSVFGFALPAAEPEVEK